MTALALLALSLLLCRGCSVGWFALVVICDGKAPVFTSYDAMIQTPVYLPVRVHLYLVLLVRSISWAFSGGLPGILPGTRHLLRVPDIGTWWDVTTTEYSYNSSTRTSSVVSHPKLLRVLSVRIAGNLALVLASSI